MSWDFTGSRHPGPGVPAGAPRKKGPARFAEVVGRDYPSLLGANLLCFAGFLPAALAVSLGLVYENFWLTLLGGVIGGGVAGPFWNGLTDTLLRTLQDDPTGWWSRWRAAFGRCWRPAVLTGALLGGLVAALLFVGSFFQAMVQTGSLPALPVLLVLVFDFLVLALIFAGYWPQLCLPLGDARGLLGRLKSSAVLVLRRPGRLFAAAAVLLAWWGGLLLLFPTSVLPAPLVGFWPGALVSLQLLYPVLEEAFAIPRYEITARSASTTLAAGQQAEIWWRRHWGWVAAALVCVSGGLGVVNVLANRTEPDLQIAVVSADALPDQVVSALQTALAPYAGDSNEDGRVVVQVNNYTVAFSGNAANPDAQMAGSTLLVSDLSAGDSALWLLEDSAGFLAVYGDKLDTARQAVWADCPVLAGLDAGSYTQATADFTGERTGQALLAGYTLLPASAAGEADSLFTVLTAR